MKVLMMMLAALTLFTMNAQAMRYDDKDRESKNVEDRRHPTYNLPAAELVQVCQKGEELGVKASLVNLKFSVAMIRQFPKNITPSHPHFPLKCMAGAKLLEDVGILCGCSAPEVQASCEEIVASLNDGGFAPCLQQK